MTIEFDIHDDNGATQSRGKRFDVFGHDFLRFLSDDVVGFHLELRLQGVMIVGMGDKPLSRCR